jgi:2-oxoglutarate ferredoxin oxidoreductase subunit gamma
MSQQGFEKYGKNPRADAVMLLDSDLVHDRPSCIWVGIPATLSAKKDLGREIVANIIMLGALTTATTVVSGPALEKAILDSVPKGTEDLNLKAMRRGQELGIEGGSS